VRPKSNKIFKEDIAEEVGVNQSVVDDLISFYFSKVRQSLSEIQDTRIYVESLGTFSIRKARLEKAITKNKSYLGNLEKHTYNGYEKTLQTKKKIKKFEGILEKIEESIERKKEFKKDNI
jgi:nucleoid DNA-binding protein